MTLVGTSIFSHFAQLGARRKLPLQATKANHNDAIWTVYVRFCSLDTQPCVCHFSLCPLLPNSWTPRKLRTWDPVRGGVSCPKNNWTSAWPKHFSQPMLRRPRGSSFVPSYYFGTII